MKKLLSISGFLPALFLWVLGLMVYPFSAYRFSAYLLLGFGCAAVCFPVLRLLRRRFPKTAKTLKIMLIIALCIFILAAAVTGCFIGRASLGHAEEACDYLIVLGAGVNGTVPSLSLQDRLSAAKAYLEANPDTLCIVSGGQGDGESITEAQCMYNWLTQRGIDPSRIVMEDKATSTKENLSYSLALIEELSGIRPETAAVVSSEYHLFRAGLMAKAQGLNAIGVPAATHRASLKVNYFLREIFAVWYYLIFGG